MPSPPSHRLRKFRLNPPQRIAALLLLALLAQCLWVISRHTLTTEDYRYAQCGREMWERPLRPSASARFGVPGYYTTCGNLRDGILAYRAAGLPLALGARLIEGPDAPASASVWELRHELSSIRFLLLLPFTLAAIALGACLWWVARRLFGNAGGYLALWLYCFATPIVDAATHPNNEILAALGLFALLYTAIGVAHAMQGPVRKWRPRIVLLAVIFGFAAAAHWAAMLVGLTLAAGLMVFLAEGRRAYLPTLFLVWPAAAFAFLFACYGFHADAYSYAFRSGAGLLWFSLGEARIFLADRRNAGISLAAAAALALWAVHRRSRYFGNTVALGLASLLFVLQTTGVQSRPWLWAIPFLLLFIGGVFADAFETRQRRFFFGLGGLCCAAQAALTLYGLPLLTR